MYYVYIVSYMLYVLSKCLLSGEQLAEQVVHLVHFVQQDERVEQQQRAHYKADGQQRVHFRYSIQKLEKLNQLSKGEKQKQKQKTNKNSLKKARYEKADQQLDFWLNENKSGE